MVITQSNLYTLAFGLKFIHTVDVDNLIPAPNVNSESTDSSSSDICVGGRPWSHFLSIQVCIWFHHLLK